MTREHIEARLDEAIGDRDAAKTEYFRRVYDNQVRWLLAQLERLESVEMTDSINR